MRIPPEYGPRNVDRRIDASHSEYEGVTVEEIKRALEVEHAFSAMLDAMQ